MLKFFRKYELQLKILAIIAWIYGAVDNFFFDANAENKNFNVFVGVIKLMLAIFFLVDVIELIKKKRLKSNFKKVE